MQTDDCQLYCAFEKHSVEINYGLIGTDLAVRAKMVTFESTKSCKSAGSRMKGKEQKIESYSSKSQS